MVKMFALQAKGPSLILRTLIKIMLAWWSLCVYNSSAGEADTSQLCKLN